MKRIAVLTSSRADYGIYLPLLKALNNDSYFDLNLIVFGTHLSPNHGYTLNQIVSDGFKSVFQIESLAIGDSPVAISTAMAQTSLKFAEFWQKHQNDFDIIFCLGDRYEMFAAVTAAIPFNLKFAHIHGGERTLGAIDNIFRHAITLSSKYHFVSCKEHGDRVSELIESKENIYDVGALSLDNLASMSLLTKEDFYSKFGVDLNRETILVTLHPETAATHENKKYVNEVATALLKLGKYQVLITLPNADTYSLTIRERLQKLPAETNNRIQCFENLGTQGYFTAMKYCSFLLGNTSSGIIEAASFGKWVINVGNRQEGRRQSKNIFNVAFDNGAILKSVEEIEKNPVFKGENIYFKENAAKNICSILKKIL